MWNTSRTIRPQINIRGNYRIAEGLRPKCAIENPIASKCYAFSESTEHFFVKDIEHPYTQTKPFGEIRGYQVGGKSLLWARWTQRWSDLDYTANAERRNWYRLAYTLQRYFTLVFVRGKICWYQRQPRWYTTSAGWRISFHPWK